MDAHFFKDKKPAHHRFIKYGRTDADVPKFLVKDLIGRYDAIYNIIVRPDLKLIVLQHQNSGYCWKYADDVTFFAASFVI